MKRTGGEAVVRALEDEGVPFTFGIPGTHNIELYDALAESESVRPVLVCHEGGGAFMADAVWRASGRLGCVNVVPGAGLTHALSGVAEAYLDTVPMLVLACGIRGDTGRAFQLHDVDQAGIAAPVTKAQLRPSEGTEIYGVVRRACRLAREGPPGPVLVEIPAEMYLTRHRPADDGSTDGREAGGRDAGPRSRATGAPPGTPEAGPRGDATGGSHGGRSEPVDPAPRPSVARGIDPPAPSGEEIREAARLLEGADRALLYLGLGAAGAAGRLVELAERLEAPVATTIQGKGVYPESHPLWLWPGLGDAAPGFVREVAASCDVTLALGCRFSEVGTGSWGFTPPGPLIHVDVDPGVFHRNFEARLAVESDARLFVDGLLDALAAGDPGTVAAGEGNRELRETIRRGRASVRQEQLAGSDGAGVSPARLLHALQDRFGPGAVYCTDSGNGTFLAMETLRLEAPGRFLAPVDYSCMGYAVPAAVGAKLARPNAPVLALPGDGAFLMTGLELLTAVREEAPLGVVVLRDGELAQIAQFQDVALQRRTASEVPDYDLRSLAGGLGVEVLELDRDGEIEEVVDRLAARLEDGRTVVLDVTVDYSRKTYFTRGVVKTTFGRMPWVDRIRFVARALKRWIAR